MYVACPLENLVRRLGFGTALKGKCHEMVVEFRPWVTSIGLN
jgi:hypothetical protein